jgi:hypothetical protein
VDQLNADSRVLKAQSLAFSGRPLEITVDDEEWWNDGDDPAHENSWGREKSSWRSHKHEKSSWRSEKQSGGNFHEPERSTTSFGNFNEPGGSTTSFGNFHEPERSTFPSFGAF